MTSLLFLVGGLVLLLVGGSGSSSSHSLRYFYTAVSQPNQGLPQFIAVGYVDDQPIDLYDSIMKKDVPKVPWMMKVAEYEVGYWDGQSQILQGTEQTFKANLATLRNRYNQSSSTGLHVVQGMYGCEVGPDGRPRGGYMQYAYDGEDFIAFDKETLTWTAVPPQAEITKQKWDPLLANSQYQKSYLEEICVEWLGRYLGYGNETLRRRERPRVKVARKEAYDGQESLICRAHGFYPKEIEITWMDGENQKQDTFTGGLVPNSDGTYHTWLSIEVDPKDRDRYRCHVVHDSLLEPLDLAWEEPASSSNMGLIVGILVGVLAALILGAGVALCMRKRRSERGYKATPGSDQGSESSTKVPMPEA